MEYVDWEVFVWVIGIITTLFTFVITYLSKKIGDIGIQYEDIKKETDSRLDVVEKSHIDNQVSLAKINKDIEYIKLQQQQISIKLDELLEKTWCKKSNKK